MENSKKFNFSESIRSKNNFDTLIDEKYNIIYLNSDDIIIRENQVFELQDDDYVSSLAEDIKNNGLDNALIVRKLDNNKYDLICGRHRLLALKKLDETKIPCIIQNLSDDESEIKLINSNLNQRHNYKLSELAKAYKIKKEILQKKYKNSLDTVSNREKFNVYEELAKDTSYSSKTIERYIKINYLIDEFKKLVDEKKLTTEKYQALTKFSELEQRHLYNFFLFNKLSFSKLNKKKIDKLLELGLSDENLEKCFIQKNSLDTMSNGEKVEDLYLELNLGKERWLEIVEILKKKKILK
ncbi:ParB/RepB/Spo0J family partition protein [Parvimonas micra]|uniref:ParB/RepB/Spo0J family partition protein n=1 Tax=Parvimonas micra TaxID=33033 RepID=UPI00123B83C1|nr:ParB/RepB/Spo0J family partition protein [Parvimonas micra]